ncbi:hypothetical protein ACH4F6_34305 [Streptomyces sp. NPDC017936]|uniref:hypothetical protein n=1 Tax=Streptomyces sp. NPDC017936 TaxID=3365016 RepID=UPI003795CE60
MKTGTLARRTQGSTSSLDGDTAWRPADLIDRVGAVPVTLIAPASTAAARFPALLAAGSEPTGDRGELTGGTGGTGLEAPAAAGGARAGDAEVPAAVGESHDPAGIHGGDAAGAAFGRRQIVRGHQQGAAGFINVPAQFAGRAIQDGHSVSSDRRRRVPGRWGIPGSGSWAVRPGRT